MTKTYIFPDGKKAVFEYDHNGVGKVTLECMDMLMGQLIAYKRCIQSRSFWDAKHCDGCIFYDDCPFNPREDEDEPNCSEKPNNCEPQTDCTEALTLLWIKNMVTDEEFYRIDARLKCISCKWWNDTIIGGSECVSKECTYQPKDEPTISKMEQVEDDAYFLELMGAVERGEISDAGANQAWYEYINHKDEPQTDCAWK